MAADKEGADGGFDNAWSVSSEAASEYLRARIPYQRFFIEAVFAYHELSSSCKSKVRWDAVLDLGCGPGQLGIQMSKKFKKVYGRDVSQQMIDIAKTLPRVEDEELRNVGLFKPAADRTFDYCVAKEDDLNMPDDSVDMIIIGSAAHWFDWSSKESSKKIWDEWTRVLRKNGSVIITTGMAVPGNWIGPEADKTRPLRKLIRYLPYAEAITKYWAHTQKSLGAESMSGDLIMPWELDPHTSQWDKSSRLFVLFDQPQDVSMEGIKPIISDPTPKWMPPSIAKYLETDAAYSELDPRWNTTTGRKLAAWVRSASGYVHYLRDHPDDKLRIGRDDDLAARLVKEACQKGGLDYDETIELHYCNSLLGLRRSQ